MGTYAKRIKLLGEPFLQRLQGRLREEDTINFI